MSAFLCSVISDSFSFSISSQQLAAAPLSDDDTELKDKNGKLYTFALFTRATLYASAGLCDSDVSVCLSVRPSHAGIVPSRAKAGS